LIKATSDLRSHDMFAMTLNAKIAVLC